VYKLDHNLIAFSGRDRVAAKRRALEYWYRNSRKSGLSLKDFLKRCRLSTDERRIVFAAGDSAKTSHA
jgi:hypothetical protein